MYGFMCTCLYQLYAPIFVYKFYKLYAPIFVYKFYKLYAPILVYKLIPAVRHF